jgi:4-hydroxybenzoate polyprenyltransferase
LGFGIAGSAGAITLAAGLALAATIVAYDWSHKTNALSPLLMGLCRLLVYVVAALAAAGTLPLQILIAGGAMWAYIVGTTYIAQQETLARAENPWPAAVLAIPAVYAVRLGIGDIAAATYAAVFLMWMSWALWRLARRPTASIQRVVTDLIAGICLFDAVVLAGTGFHVSAGCAAALFLLTLYLQRWLPGT